MGNGEDMWTRIDCDFVEDTERGLYCCLNHYACDSESCDTLKYGVGKEDIEQALWKIMNQHFMIEVIESNV